LIGKKTKRKQKHVRGYAVTANVMARAAVIVNVVVAWQRSEGNIPAGEPPNATTCNVLHEAGFILVSNENPK
jgi:hypothetical protein